MGRYTAISEFGNALVRQLQQDMVPDVISNKDSIGLCSPAEHGDFIVGVHLYDVKESEEIQSNVMISRSLKEARYPSIYLSLYYMITVFLSSDIKYRAVEEQKILGKIVQTINEYPCFDGGEMEPVMVKKATDITIRMEKLELDDKIKIFNVPNAGYRTSLFYKVAPVEIESTKVKKIQRVMDVDFAVEEKQ